MQNEGATLSFDDQDRLFPPFQILDHVEVDEDGATYVNGDDATLIYKFEGPDGDHDDDDD